MILFLVTCGLVAAFAGLILYARWNYGALEHLRIPVLTPHAVLGSLPDLHTKVQQLEDVHRFHKFGCVYGIYEGRSPQIHVCDPELVRLIFVKEQDHFRDREAIDLGHPVIREVLDIQPYDKWKQLRSLWTPLFSIGRIKIMSEQIQQITSEHVAKLAAKAEGSPGFQVNARTIFTRILVDVITTCLHGVRLECDTLISEIMKSVLREGERYDWTYNLTLVFPFLKPALSPFRTKGIESFHALISNLMRTRAGTEGAESNSDSNKRDRDHNSNYTDMLLGIQSNLAPGDQNRYTATAQALELYFGIYDSTGTVLTLLLYYLAKNPGVQELLMEEIDIEESDGDYPYLTACLNETMRLSPPFLRAERICTQDWTHEGLRIPKGMPVLVPLFALHRDPANFPDPETFDPNRFMPGQQTHHSYAFAPFGHGPKNCVGMKFAYVTMKLVTRKLLMEFRAEAVDGVTKLKYKPGTLLAAQYEPIIVNLVRRN